MLGDGGSSKMDRSRDEAGSGSSSEGAAKREKESKREGGDDRGREPAVAVDKI